MSNLQPIQAFLIRTKIILIRKYRIIFFLTIINGKFNYNNKLII